MKNWNWKQWTGFGIIVAALLTLVVLHFVQPQVSYAFTEAMTFGGVVVGFFSGYLLKKNNIINKPDKKQLLND